jgi:hypothetical protein
MRRLIAWIPLGLLCAACCVTPPGSGGGSPLAPAAPVGPPIVVTNICAVEDAYRDNEIAAGATYPRGALIDVTFRLESVQVSLGTTVLHPRRCMFSTARMASTETSRVSSLHPGDEVHLMCTMGAYFVSIDLTDCRFASN